MFRKPKATLKAPPPGSSLLKLIVWVADAVLLCVPFDDGAHSSVSTVTWMSAGSSTAPPVPLSAVTSVLSVLLFNAVVSHVDRHVSEAARLNAHGSRMNVVVTNDGTRRGTGYRQCHWWAKAVALAFPMMAFRYALVMPAFCAGATSIEKVF